MTVLYNEFDKNAAAWLRELISMGSIADGYVDQRSILELTPSDIGKYRCAHLFAGIGGWSYALRLAGIPDDYPVWTASLPCQPFSLAGKGLGKNDERHLLPHFLELVRKCRPPVIFGEQVANAINITGQLRNQDQDLQLLQKKQAYIRLLAELQRSGGKSLRALQELGEIEKKGEQTEKFFGLQEMAGREPRSGSSKFRNLSCERAGDGIGYHCGMGAREDTHRLLRINRDTLRLNNTESLERAIIGQNRQQFGLFEEQYPSRNLCFECDDEYLGRTENLGSIEWDIESSKEKINRAYREIDEQVEGAFRHGWLDDLQTTMEREGYAVGHCVLGAHSVGAPHIRQRLYWVAYASSAGLQRYRNSGEQSFSDKWEGTQRFNGESSANSPWSGCDWLYCRDNKYRPVKPGLKPLVNGIPRAMVYSLDSSITPNETGEARSMRLKGYGNAIVPQVAAEFIKAVFETLNLY